MVILDYAKWWYRNCPYWTYAATRAGATIVFFALRSDMASSGVKSTRLSGPRVVAFGTIVVGAIDAVDAIVVFGLRGVSPVRIFQGIARGLLGPAAIRGGLPAAFLGLLIHLFVAFGIVTTYYVASRKLRILKTHPVLCGAVYGVLAYFFMNRVVIPLSAIGGGGAFSLPLFINGILIHAFGIGIPTALIVARSH
jgi:hypothetical protein